MQSRLQQFQKSLLKKQSSKLNLEIKLSLINSNYYEKTLIRSPKYSQSPTTKQSITVRAFDTPRQDTLPIDGSTDQIDDRVEKLEYEVDKQFFMIQKFKDVLKKRLEECQNLGLCRQKHMKELTLKRKIQIQTLKREVKLTIKCTIEQREHTFHKLQSQFDRTVDEFFKQWKKMKKYWKSQLKRILQKIEECSNSKNSTKFTSPQLQQSQNQSKTSLKSLQNELKAHIISSQKQSIKLQLQLSLLIQKFELKRQQVKQRFNNSLLQILESVQNLQKNIKSEVKKEHLESEENREKLLLLFEENVQRIQDERLNQENQKMKKYKPQNILYRHLT